MCSSFAEPHEVNWLAWTATLIAPSTPKAAIQYHVKSTRVGEPQSSKNDSGNFTCMTWKTLQNPAVPCASLMRITANGIRMTVSTIMKSPWTRSVMNAASSPPATV